MDLIAIEHISEIEKNLGILLLAIIGGIWTAYIYFRDWTKYFRPVSQSIMDTEEIYNNKIDKYLVKVVITIINNGNRDTCLRIPDDALNIAKIDFDDSGRAIFKETEMTTCPFFPL
ncbi:MAG: hypothetical protein ACKVE4_04310 [Dissulfuribacterales bacterium]